MAEAQPPPVILYPHSQDQSHNNGAGHYSQGGPAIQPIEPPPQPPVNNYPPQNEPRLPETRYTGHTDGRSGTQTENRHTVTPHRPPNPPLLQPLGNVETSASAVSVLLASRTGESRSTAKGSLHQHKSIVRCSRDSTRTHVYTETSVLSATSHRLKCPTNRQHARHPRGRFPVLPTGPNHWTQGHLQSIPVLQASRPLHNRPKVRQGQLPHCEPQGET